MSAIIVSAEVVPIRNTVCFNFLLVCLYIACAQINTSGFASERCTSNIMQKLINAAQADSAEFTFRSKEKMLFLQVFQPPKSQNRKSSRASTGQSCLN